MCRILCSGRALVSAPLSIQGASLGFPASTGFFLSGHKPVAVQGCVLKLILSDEFTSVPDSIRKEKELFLLGLFSLWQPHSVHLRCLFNVSMWHRSVRARGKEVKKPHQIEKYVGFVNHLYKPKLIRILFVYFSVSFIPSVPLFSAFIYLSESGKSSNINHPIYKKKKIICS